MRVTPRAKKADVNPKPLLLCESRQCNAPTHYKDCPTCAGFGLLRLTDGRTIVALAEEAIAGRSSSAGATAFACPSCCSAMGAIPSPSL